MLPGMVRSFFLEQRRKPLKGKQREGRIINIKLIQYTSVISNMQRARHFLELAYVQKHREFW